MERLLLAVALLICPVFAPSHALAEEMEEVRIIRDPWGVPHVIGDSDYGSMYGLGWATAEDQLEMALDNYWTIQGRRSELDGRPGVGSDRTIRHLRIVADVEAWLKNAPPEVVEIANGYADGMNAWMKAHPDRVPDWAEPVQPAWPLAMGRLIDLIPQVSQANRKLRGLAPRMKAPSKLGRATEDARLGSNAWAVGPTRGADGKSMLLTDPHLPWIHEFRLYESHVRGKTFECAGAGFIGVPFPQFARNAHVTWGWTANGVDHADVYRMDLNPENPDEYLLDGVAVPFEEEETIFRLRDGEELKETLRYSVHGPVIHVNEDEGYAVASRLSMFGQGSGGSQYLEMVRAKNLDELNQAMETLQVCHFNQIAADTSGHIRFLWGGRVPIRPEGVNFKRPINGSDSANLWASDSVTPISRLPQVVDPPCGFVQNCNNRPQNTTGTDADPQPESFATGSVSGQEIDTVRAWYLRKLLAGDDTISVDRGREIATDSYMIPHGPMRGLLERSWEKYGDAFEQREEIAESVEGILAWDGYPMVNNPVPTIFTLWLWKAFNEKVMLPVSLMEKSIEEVDEKFAMQLFGGMIEAQKELRSLIPFPRVPWGMLHIIRRGGRVWPVESGMYPAISLMNANLAPKGKKLEDINCVVGSAYVAFHVLDENGIRSETILPLGQTDDEALPYVNAMTDLYVNRELKPLPFTDEELAAVDTTETIVRFKAPGS